MTGSVEQVAEEQTVKGRVPDFFIVGHSKSGTTALYEMLRRHPQLFLPEVKEPMFFARNTPSSVEARHKTFEQTGIRTETLDDYLSLFSSASPDQRMGEASTFYLWSHDAPGRIAELQPEARIIAILREPASFLRSLHLQMLQNHAEVEKDLAKAIALEGPRREGKQIPTHAYWPQALMYTTERVRYLDQLRRFHSVFPPEHVLVIIYDDFRRENEATVRRVLRFLDVDDTIDLEVMDANPTVGVRSIRLDTTIREIREGRSSAGRLVRGTVRSLTSHRLREKLFYPLRRRLVYGTPPPPDEAVMTELRKRLAPDVAELSEYLGRDLVELWGYDELV
jgi:hypothetical protein